MANKMTHAAIGALIAFTGYGLYKYIKEESMSLEEIVVSLIVGGLFGLVPDIIEPATSPNHRAFFHSILMLIMLVFVNYEFWRIENFSDTLKLIILAASIGYGSHILTDSTTEKRVPLIA